MNAVSTMNQLKNTHKQKFQVNFDKDNGKYPKDGRMHFADQKNNNSVMFILSINKYIEFSEKFSDILDKNDSKRIQLAREYKEQVYKLCKENKLSLEDAYKIVDAEWNKKTTIEDISNISWAEFDEKIKEQNSHDVSFAVNEFVDKMDRVDPEILDKLYSYALDELKAKYFQAIQYGDLINGSIDDDFKSEYETYIQNTERMMNNLNNCIGGKISFKLESKDNLFESTFKQDSQNLLDKNKDKVVKSLLSSLAEYDMAAKYEEKLYNNTSDINLNEFKPWYKKQQSVPKVNLPGEFANENAAVQRAVASYENKYGKLSDEKSK